MSFERQTHLYQIGHHEETCDGGARGRAQAGLGRDGKDAALSGRGRGRSGSARGEARSIIGQVIVMLMLMVVVVVVVVSGVDGGELDGLDDGGCCDGGHVPGFGGRRDGDYSDGGGDGACGLGVGPHGSEKGGGLKLFSMGDVSTVDIDSS
jgi:hypothetical protein